MARHYGVLGVLDYRIFATFERGFDLHNRAVDRYQRESGTGARSWYWVIAVTSFWFLLLICNNREYGG